MRRPRERSFIRSAKDVPAWGPLVKFAGLRSFTTTFGMVDAVNRNDRGSTLACALDWPVPTLRTFRREGEGEGVRMPPASFRFLVRDGVFGSDWLASSIFPFKGTSETGGVGVADFSWEAAKALKSAVNKTECAHPAYGPQICCSLEDTSTWSFGVMGGVDFPE